MFWQLLADLNCKSLSEWWKKHEWEKIIPPAIQSQRVSEEINDSS